jgi:hypothetical protein
LQSCCSGHCSVQSQRNCCRSCALPTWLLLPTCHSLRHAVPVPHRDLQKCKRWFLCCRLHQLHCRKLLQSESSHSSVGPLRSWFLLPDRFTNAVPRCSSYQPTDWWCLPSRTLLPCWHWKLRYNVSTWHVLRRSWRQKLNVVPEVQAWPLLQRQRLHATHRQRPVRWWIFLSGR